MALEVSSNWGRLLILKRPLKSRSQAVTVPGENCREAGSPLVHLNSVKPRAMTSAAFDSEEMTTSAAVQGRTSTLAASASAPRVRRKPRLLPDVIELIAYLDLVLGIVLRYRRDLIHPL